MPSIFSRSRTALTPKKSSQDPYDELGRVTTKSSSRTLRAGTPSPIPPSKKDKKKDKQRGRTISTPTEPDLSEFAVPDGSFLQLSLDPPRYEPGEEPSQEHRNLLDYGHLSFQRHVVLGLEEVARLVDVVGDELGSRGLTTPFIFSTLALDVAASGVRRLIQAFLKTCGNPSREADRLWREEATFAGPHELGMCLRWGLARLVRIMGGQEVRGMLSFDTYVEWREAETALKYPESHFGAFLETLEPVLRALLVSLLSLLTRFAAHSSSSGHTPPTLSPLFGPLLFGLGPSTLAFHHVYVRYLHTTTATEHLILSFIRWQDAPGRSGSGATALGVPTRLKAWIQGYPAMLPLINKNERPQPRRGARTVRLVSVRRNVRMYSPDLVKNAASWGIRPHGSISSAGSRSFSGSKEWERISPPTLKLPPRYSDSYKKRMVLPSTFHPDTGPSSTTSTLNAPSLSSSISTGSTASSFLDADFGVLGSKPEEDRFRSLTDLKWGEFEELGFGGLGDEKKLQFDLTEGARAARAAKRSTLSWQDFSSAGFSRSDGPLRATLQFSQPVANAVSQWPSQSAELNRKLKKTQKALPPFGWDTEPIMGGEEVIEEPFLDVFCDLIYGGGWLDTERTEDTQRGCNWALVEFKSLPLSRSTVSGTSDPRSSTTLILFEEFVPLEYRQQLAESGTGRRHRLPSLFSSSKKAWKPATTLNGRPYVVGHVPRSPSYREVEFEGLLSTNGSVTKIISLKPPERRPSTIMPSPISTIAPSPIVTRPAQPQLFLIPPQPVASQASPSSPIKRTSSRQSDVEPPVPPQPTATPVKKPSRFRLPVSPSGPRPRTTGLPPAEYDTVDFEARLATSFDDDDIDGSSSSKRSNRQSQDDAWVDILVASNSRRMAGQDADRNGQGLKARRSDPELASQEVSEVLASVTHVQSEDEDDDLEPIYRLDADVLRRDDSTVGYSDTGPASIAETLEKTPAPSVLVEDEVEDPIVATPPPKKRLGYFDLHPERRTPKLESEDEEQLEIFEPGPAPQSTFDDARVHLEQRNSMYEDPRALFERPSLDSQGSQGDSSYEGAYDINPHPPVPPKDISATSHEREVSAIYYPEEQYLNTIPQRNTPSLSIPSVDVTSVDVTPSKDPRRSPEPSASKIPQSKTASLIEMYRERERGSASPSPLPPSRLPIRTGASLTPLPQAIERPVSPAPIPSPIPSPTPSPPTPTASLPSEVPTLVPYIHGAPLHNVLEEEEEEEE